MLLTSSSLPPDAPSQRHDARRQLTVDIAEAILLERAPWETLVQSIARHFQTVDWKWNGLYRLDTPDRLELHTAAVPPVCQTSLSDGQVGTSGMCFDALHRRQTISTNDAHSWPGYVNCDGESGLNTSGALVVPVSLSDGRHWGVWDLDSEQPLVPSDGIFMERLIACLSTLAPLPQPI